MVKPHKCPICGEMTQNEPYRPFCSKHCADVDLGRWFNGSYAVKAEEMDEEDYEELEKEYLKSAQKSSDD